MLFKQLEACAAKLPEEARHEFLALHRLADAVSADALEMRQAAWVLYHTHVPPEPKKPKKGAA
jgi:hypothetical protein